MLYDPEADYDLEFQLEKDIDEEEFRDIVKHYYAENALTLVARENLTMDDINKAKSTISLDDLFRAQDALETSVVPCTWTSTMVSPKYITVATIPNEKETNMGYEYNMEVDQRNHLKRRLDDVRHEKRTTMQTKYGIGLEHPAKTKDEVLTALKNGEIEFNSYFYDADGKLKGGYQADGTFSLKNPKTDCAGYESAEKLLGTAYTAAKDAIIVKPLTDGLAALNEFEKAEF